MGNNHQYPPHPSLIREGEEKNNPLSQREREQLCEQVEHTTAGEGATHVVKPNNSCQSLPCHSDGVTHASMHDYKNLCKTYVLDAAATLPPHSSSLPKGARGQKKNTLPWGRAAKKLSSLKRTYRPNVLTSYRLKKSAFTLAEVLVTLGIIGVVSAMTVPTLMQNHQRKVYVTQLHKIYNQLQQAALQYTNDRNALNLTEAGINSEDAAANFVKTYFNVIQDCGTDQTPCFPSTGEYKKLSGATITTWYPKRHFVLADGTSLGTYYSLSNGAIVEFWVDTNGTKGPNIVGRDFFVMYMYNNGGLDDLAASIPMSKEQRETSFTNICMSDSGSNYHGCFGKLLNDNWEMTY